MARSRDYRAEYRRRVERAVARGLSRSQGRGHARADEAPIRPTAERDRERLEAALRSLRQIGKQGEAARSVGISPERLRRFLRQTGLAERRGKSWSFSDDRLRRMTVISKGDARSLTLRGFDEASVNGKHLAAVGKFIATNEVGLLRPFDGVSITDASGRRHPLETDPNALHRLASAGSEVFHDVYRLVV